ncbi:MAG: hypothetical protein HGA22_13930, partial [Clostridiales bacterium]|nr:hypothetical protein [Clostridiales bacterium]
MKRKSIVILALFILLLGILPVNVFAYTPPAGFGAPEGFAVILGDYQDTLPDFTGFDTTASVPADIRSLIDQADDSASDFNTSGNYNLFVLMQLDFKTDTGAWHYSSDWDSGDKLNDQDFTKNFGVGKGFYTASTDFGTDEYFNKYFSSETPSVKSYFDSHTWQFRSRFVVKYSGPSGEYVSLTPWSSVVSYSNKPAADPDKLINHAPVLKSAKLGTYANGQPYMTVITDKPNSQVEELASISGNWVRTEIWLKVGTDDWKLARESEFKEQLTFDAVDYFGELANYNDTAFDVKVRYSFDYYNYPQAGKSGKIYSPFSNVISKNLGAWSNASTWATPELQKASDAGLIPAILIGADMTKPITREEFCELSVLLYEKVTGKAATAAEPNPFNDTTNPQILKAYKLGITQGTSAITFSPKTLINREQCAAMLFRAIKV